MRLRSETVMLAAHQSFLGTAIMTLETMCLKPEQPNYSFVYPEHGQLRIRAIPLFNAGLWKTNGTTIGSTRTLLCRSVSFTFFLQWLGYTEENAHSLLRTECETPRLRQNTAAKGVICLRLGIFLQ